MLPRGEFDEIKLDIRALQDEIKDLQRSVQYHDTVDDFQLCVNQAVEKQVFVDSSITRHGEEINEIIEIIDKQEYTENQDRRNNLKIFGLPESCGQESWVDSENLVKANIKETLCIEEDIEIERAHRVGEKREFFT